MAQHDMNIANQGFPATRADLNNALQALVSNSSGTSAPSTTFANQWWYDTTNNKMYIRNEANNAWIEVFTLDQTNNEWQLTTGVVQAKDSDGLALKTDDGTTRLFIKDSDGNIGLGTTSPSEQLNLVGSSGTAKIRFDGDSSNLQNNFIGITGYDDLIIASDEANSASASTIQFRVDGSERLKIDSTGDIILGGTTTADETNKSFNFQMRSHDTDEENFNVMQLEAEATFNQISIGGGTSALNCATQIRFLTGSVDTHTGGERLRVDNSGFHVDAGKSGGMFGVFDTSSSGDGHILLKRNGTAEYQIGSGTSDEFFIYNYNNSAYAFRITSTGNLSAQGVYNDTGSDSPNVVVDSSGNIYRSTSALKYKKDVRDIESIDIDRFRPVRYKSAITKDDDTKDCLGFISDEVHDDGLTELVTYGVNPETEEKEVEGFRYDRMTVILTKVVQEQKALIADLLTRVEALENA